MKMPLHLSPAVALAAALAALPSAASASFAPDTIAVLRVGDGSVPFNFDGPDADASNDYLAQRVTVDLYRASTPGAAPLQSFAVPAGAAGLVLTSRNDDHDGHLNLSADGQFLTFAGYGAAAGDHYVVAGAGVPRAVGRLDGGGGVQVATLNGGAYNGVTINAAVTLNGSTYWTAGSGSADQSGGIRYATPTGPGGAWTTTDVSPAATTGPTNALDPHVSTRSARVVDGKLVVSTASGGSFTNRGNYLITQNGGLPTQPNAAGSVVLPTALIVNSEGNLSDGLNADGDGKGKFHPKSDAVYLDLDRDGVRETAYSTGGKEDIAKWSLTQNGWLRTEVVNLPTVPTTPTATKQEVNALDFTIAGSTVNLFVAADNGVYRVRDTGGIGAAFVSNDLSASRVVLASSLFAAAPAGSEFRGVAAVPEPAGAAGVLCAAAALCGRRRRRVTA